MATSEGQAFFFASLDMYLSGGVEPQKALRQAVGDYAYVYHTDDGRSELARASTRVLEWLREHRPEAGDGDHA